MTEGYTKIYKKERELLRKANSVAAYEVYMHLKDKYNYYKGDCYDAYQCISGYLHMPIRTVKDAIKRLKEAGLITINGKDGRKNIYGFPIVESIENPKKDTAVNTNNNTDKKEEESMGTYVGTVVELKEKNSNLSTEAPKVPETPKAQPTQIIRKTEIITRMDRCISERDKTMALKQVNLKNEESRNIGRLADRLDVFLHGFSQAEKAYYYKHLLYNLAKTA